MMRSRLAPLCIIVLLGAWTGLGCARHVVVERDRVQALNQKNWTIHSAPATAEDESEATLQQDID
jgi:hypothetical protein